MIFKYLISFYLKPPFWALETLMYLLHQFSAENIEENN
jgi:hypothetical protein